MLEKELFKRLIKFRKIIKRNYNKHKNKYCNKINKNF